MNLSIIKVDPEFAEFYPFLCLTSSKFKLAIFVNFKYFGMSHTEGLYFKKALPATAHKLIKVILAMLLNKSYSCPEVVKKSVGCKCSL